jgi:hypothetical protein
MALVGRLRALDPTLLIAALTTVAASLLAVRVGASTTLGALAVAGLFIAMVLTFLGAPHLAVSGMVVLFALIPSLKVFLTPAIGGVKDLDAVAAMVATVIVAILRRRAVDRWVGSFAIILLALYVINPEGGHGVAWAQGLRLVGEPLLLLLVGLILPQPRRTLRWVVWTIVGTACAIALFGVLQQGLGAPRLVSFGYQYNVQVRFASGTLRSFGTFDDPFAYAAFLLLALVALLFGTRRTGWTSLAGAILLAGLAVSLVRTSALVCVALLGLVLLRRGHGTTGVTLAAATALTGLALLVTHASGSESRTIPVGFSASGTPTVSSRPGAADVILNGRISAWKAAVGDQAMQWVFGRGVGTVGTAAARARYALAPPTASAAKTTTAVDSGYLATVADVGIVGLGVLLMLFGRLWLLGLRAARRGSDAGWLAVGALMALMLDALTRASFTGFPTAFLAFLFVGIALNAAFEEAPEAMREPFSRAARGTARRGLEQRPRARTA